MSEGEFIDTHAHLEMMDDISGVIERANSKGVSRIIAVSSDLNSSIRSTELSGNSFIPMIQSLKMTFPKYFEY